jgi:hypothetical protein
MRTAQGREHGRVSVGLVRGCQGKTSHIGEVDQGDWSCAVVTATVLEALTGLKHGADSHVAQAEQL